MWHFPQTKHGLFEDYINTWLKSKQEASGWPRANMTEEEKRQYIDEYYAKEKIQLEPEKIENNPGLCTLAEFNVGKIWPQDGQKIGL